MLNLHATCVAHAGRAVLLRGPSGSGKSDLALRAMDAGCGLVADDRTVVRASAGALVAAPAPGLAGLIEVRGVGILEVPHLREAPLALVCDLVPPDRVERMPEPETVEILGIRLPLVRLYAFHAGTPAALRLLLSGAARRHPAPLAA